LDPGTKLDGLHIQDFTLTEFKSEGGSHIMKPMNAATAGVYIQHVFERRIAFDLKDV